MAYPSITYNQTTGSNTAPSDAVATSGGTSTTVTGTQGTNTITFSSTVDLTGVVDDDSDYIGVGTSGGDRKLYRITAFTGGVGTCTAVTVEPSIDAGVSAVGWHVNGTRATFLDNFDSYDWMPGWTVLLDGDQTRTGGNLRVGNNFSGTHDGTDPPLTIKPLSSTGRAAISSSHTAGEMLRLNTHALLQLERLDFSMPNSTASGTYVYASSGNLSAYDCTFSAPLSTATSFVFSGSGDSMSFVHCYFEGGTNHVIDITGNDCTLINCWLDCKGTHGTSSALDLGPSYTATVINTAITESAGDGINLNRQGNPGRQLDWMIRNCTVADCSGDGLTFSGTPSSTTGSSWNVFVMNTLISGNGGWGLNTNSGNIAACGFIGYNAFYNNTSGEYSDSTVTKGGDVTLTADPFTNAGADNYTINDAAGGGADLKAAGLNAMPDRP